MKISRVAESAWDFAITGYRQPGLHIINKQTPPYRQTTEVTAGPWPWHWHSKRLKFNRTRTKESARITCTTVNVTRMHNETVDMLISFQLYFKISGLNRLNHNETGIVRVWIRYFLFGKVPLTLFRRLQRGGLSWILPYDS